MNHEPLSHQSERKISWYRSQWAIVGAMLGVIALFFLVREHWNHLAGYGVYLILLLCPLMHLFGHGHHGSGHGADSGEH